MALYSIVARLIVVTVGRDGTATATHVVKAGLGRCTRPSISRRGNPGVDPLTFGRRTSRSSGHVASPCEKPTPTPAVRRRHGPAVAALVIPGRGIVVTGHGPHAPPPSGHKMMGQNRLVAAAHESHPGAGALIASMLLLNSSHRPTTHRPYKLVGTRLNPCGSSRAALLPVGLSVPCAVLLDTAAAPTPDARRCTADCRSPNTRRTRRPCSAQAAPKHTASRSRFDMPPESRSGRLRRCEPAGSRGSARGSQRCAPADRTNSRALRLPPRLPPHSRR